MSSTRTATLSLLGLVSRSTQHRVARNASPNTLRRSHPSPSPAPSRSLSSTSHAARPQPSVLASAALSPAPFASNTPTDTLRRSSVQPLGASLTPQDILSHFSRAPFPSTNIFGKDAELAKRAMTHESFMYAKDGNNRRLAFLGRRSLKMFVILFLHSCLNTPSLSSSSRSYILRLLESSELDNVLHTSRLGDKVGRDLQLEKAMRWTPAVTDGQRGPLETGLFKIRGVCLEALVGAVYHQSGAEKASRFFHARILPSLLSETFPQGLPDELKQLASTRQAEADKALA